MFFGDHNLKNILFKMLKPIPNNLGTTSSMVSVTVQY